jgi:hypothetical protein
MKLAIKRFKSLAVCLKELEPFIRNGEHLQTGKPFEKFDGLRSREILGNWLVCVAVNFERQADVLTLMSDPEGGDGILYDTAAEHAWRTEHVLVPTNTPGETRDIETQILSAIGLKQQKGGAAYASGKTLIVFLNAGGGPWHPNKVAKQLPKPLDFDDVWVVGLQRVDSGSYVYGVTQLDTGEGDAPTWMVRLGENFDAWRVERFQ